MAGRGAVDAGRAWDQGCHHARLTLGFHQNDDGSGIRPSARTLRWPFARPHAGVGAGPDAPAWRTRGLQGCPDPAGHGYSPRTICVLVRQQLTRGLRLVKPHWQQYTLGPLSCKTALVNLSSKPHGSVWRWARIEFCRGTRHRIRMTLLVNCSQIGLRSANQV